MDNDTLQRKNRGAFYTPAPYAEKSLELVREAIARVPEGNDYVIIDRCAGTGNLERGLSDEELSHCILSTAEYDEYKVLRELFGAKVRHLIPSEAEESAFCGGMTADALSEAYIHNNIITRYINDPQYTVILFENPPYAETTSVEHQKSGAGKGSSAWKNSFAVTEMKREVRGTASNDLGNAFIWSAFRYYLRQPTDSYVVYSPVKYWKAQHLIDRRFLGGFAFNRKHFHTCIDACVMVALWSCERAELEEVSLDAYDLEGGNRLVPCGRLPVRRIRRRYSTEYYDKRKFDGDRPGGVLLGYDGLPARSGLKRTLKPIRNDNIVGYMVIDGANFDNPDLMSVLIRCGLYKGHGCYLRADNYLEKLPMFCASRYITYNRAWTERARIMKSADGAGRFFADVKSGRLKGFLLKCLLFTCLEMQNHCRSFVGDDHRLYINQLCLDTTNGRTAASADLAGLTPNGAETELLAQWNRLLEHAKAAEEYNPAYHYGVFQIHAEIDTCDRDDASKQIRYHYPELHAALAALKRSVKDYYNSEIVPVLFDYEFIK